MSRHGRHGRNPHPHPATRPVRPAAPAADRAPATVDVRVAAPAEPIATPPLAAPVFVAGPIPPTTTLTTTLATPPEPRFAPQLAPLEPAPVRFSLTAPAGFTGQEPVREHPIGGDGDPSRPTCTQAQLRRFIKSRPWVPMHELRRRFGIFGGDDDVSLIRVGDRTLFIGLPVAEGRMVAELLTAGDVGHELSMDPEAPVVVGVYPMRPVPRS